MEEPTPRHRRESPALRLIVRRRREPLDLNADVFRYLVDREGNVQPVVMVPAPFCDCGRRHR